MANDITEGNQSEKARLDELYWGKGTGQPNDLNFFQSPGSANVGGSVGGAKAESEFFKSGMKNNDKAQADNAAALKLSLGNMAGDRGEVVPENTTLLARQDRARMAQGRALDLSRDAAMGNAPSAADAQMGMDMNSIMAGQAGAAGSARGLSALGGAQATGAAGVGMAGTRAAMAGGTARSSEVNDAMSMYGSAAGNMGQGDINRLGQGNRNALGNQSLNDAWTEGNANLAINQGKLGLGQATADDAWYNQSEDPFKRQLSYDSRMNAIQNGANADAADAINAKSQAERDRNKALINGAVQTGLTIGGTMVGGPAGAAAGGMGASYITQRM